eukprot:ANDGO_01954.mRNA.1 putative tyrosine-protein phosphatase At1g05000
MVFPGIYRSAIPAPEHLSYLSTLGLKSVLVLEPDLLERRMRDWIDGYRIHLFCPTLQSLWTEDAAYAESWDPLDHDHMKLCLEFLLDANNHPVLIMCASGVHLTSAVVGCLKRLMGWSVAMIVDEYRLFARGRTRYAVERLVELFETDAIDLDYFSFFLNIPSTGASYAVSAAVPNTSLSLSVPPNRHRASSSITSTSIAALHATGANRTSIQMQRFKWFRLEMATRATEQVYENSQLDNLLRVEASMNTLAARRKEQQHEPEPEQRTEKQKEKEKEKEAGTDAEREDEKGSGKKKKKDKDKMLVKGRALVPDGFYAFQWYAFHHNAPFLSCRSTYNVKKSILDDDDD